MSLHLYNIQILVKSTEWNSISNPLHIIFFTGPILMKSWSSENDMVPRQEKKWVQSRSLAHDEDSSELHCGWDEGVIDSTSRCMCVFWYLTG